jgi:carbon storage regulator
MGATMAKPRRKKTTGRSSGGLCLSRRKGESVVIGIGANQVIVSVDEVRGDKVQLNFNGPKDVPIHRSEVAAAIHEEEILQSTGGPQNECPQTQTR